MHHGLALLLELLRVYWLTLVFNILFLFFYIYFIYSALRGKDYLGYDDTLDAFGLHGVGGIVGGIMTGVLHQKSISLLDGVETEGGAIDGNWTKVGQQIAACVSIAAWSFFMSYAILFIINKIPGLQLRVTPDEERDGQDVSEMGESAYGNIIIISCLLILSF